MSEPGEVSPPALTGRRLFLAVFLVAALLAAPRHDHNENRTLDLLRALEHGRLSIDEDASNTSDRAWVPDAGTASVDTSVASAPRGHFYSGGSPGLAFALLPVHEVARFLPESLHDLVLVLAGAALPLALGALGVRRALLALAVSGERASGAALVHALATLALPFGTRLYASSLVVALVSWSLSLVLARRGSPPKEGGRSGGGTRESLGVSLLAGVLAASAVACDYSVALPVAVLALLSLTRGGARSLLAFAGGTVAPALALAAYHQACFGSPWKTAYDFHADPTIAATLSQGAWGFTWPRPRILLELIVGTRRGFLWTQPAALVGLAGLVAAARRERAFALALVAAFLVILANASRARDWDAGASFGARYTTPALPFLALGLPRGLELLGRTARPVALASGALAFVGATSEWGFSVLTSLESIVVLGPRARGLTQIFPGVDPKVVAGPDALAVALLSALAVSSALVLAWLVLQERRRDVAPLVLLPWLACVPVTVSVLSHGPTAVDARFVELTRREARRQIASAEDADTARAIAGVMSWRWRVLGDPGLYTEALDRVLELDPGDERTRALREKWKP